MDGGQVALSADGKTQFSTWMNADGGKRRLFYAAVEPGKQPARSSLVDFPGQQGHPVVAPLEDGRAVVVFEANDTIGALLLSKDGKVEKKELLGRNGRFPRLAKTATGITAAWETSDDVQVATLSSDWWKAE